MGNMLTLAFSMMRTIQYDLQYNHIETSNLICTAKQITGRYVI